MGVVNFVNSFAYDREGKMRRLRVSRSNSNLYFTSTLIFLQAMFSNMVVMETQEGSSPCIEISDIKYETFTVRNDN